MVDIETTEDDEYIICHNDISNPGSITNVEDEDEVVIRNTTPITVVPPAHHVHHHQMWNKMLKKEVNSNKLV